MRCSLQCCIKYRLERDLAWQAKTKNMLNQLGSTHKQLAAFA